MTPEERVTKAKELHTAIQQQMLSQYGVVLNVKFEMEKKGPRFGTAEVDIEYALVNNWTPPEPANPAPEGQNS